MYMHMYIVGTCMTIVEVFCNPHSVTTYTMHMYKESHSTCRLSTGHVQTCTNCTHCTCNHVIMYTYMYVYNSPTCRRIS